MKPAVERLLDRRSFFASMGKAAAGASAFGLLNDAIEAAMHTEMRYAGELADKIMSLERDIKRVHLALLVRIKNALTAEQIARLEAVRRGK